MITKTKKSAAVVSQEYWNFDGMNKALEVAVYYGFNISKVPHIEKNDYEQSKSFKEELEHSFDKNGMTLSAEEKVALLRVHFGKNIPSQLPISLCSIAQPENRKRDKRKELHLDILGASCGSADALLIKTAYEMLLEQGCQELTVEINSIGDRDSIARLTKEMTVYLRKHAHELHPDCKQELKSGPFGVLACTHEKCKTIKDTAPRPIAYLSEPSRQHFKELLEFMESMNLPYTINNQLIGCHNFCSHTIFRIVGKSPSKNEIEVLACGARWNGVAKKVGFKKDIPAASMSVILEDAISEKTAPKRIKKPQAFFIQMGPEAKLKSLNIIEILRQEKIPLYHTLTKDKLVGQLTGAELLKVPYILIMGQKETIENTILVREMLNRCQDTVKISELAEYLRKVL